MSTHSKKTYGMELIVSIHNVNQDMNDVKKLKHFAKKLVLQGAEMTLGPIHAWPDQDSQEDQEKFVASRGISICQFLCESSLTIHFINQERKCFINLFSCKPFMTQKVMALINDSIKGDVVQQKLIIRP
jgi:S-adenosylmethionine/arginine decarboxylase-like enzyme